MIFYKTTQQSLDALIANGVVYVYVICSQECKPSKRSLSNWESNKIRTFVDKLKDVLKKTRNKQTKQLSVKQIVFSGVDLGYVGSFTTTYEKHLM
jgi:hypothetical protein